MTLYGVRSMPDTQEAALAAFQWDRLLSRMGQAVTLLTEGGSWHHVSPVLAGH
jgi:hypothetical protein